MHDLARVLEDLADDFPLLRSLVDQRAGGQKRLPLPGRGTEQVPGPLFANLPTGDDVESVAAPPAGDKAPIEGVPPAEGQPASPSPEGEAEPSPPPHAAPGDSANAESSAIVGTLATVPGRRRPARYGLLVQFESRPDDAELGRLVDSTIWINDAHPAYVRRDGVALVRVSHCTDGGARTGAAGRRPVRRA